MKEKEKQELDAINNEAVKAIELEQLMELMEEKGKLLETSDEDEVEGAATCHPGH